MEERPLRRYSRDEVQEILRRALEEHVSTGASFQDVVEIGREVGIPDAAILAAASSLDEDREVER